MLTETMKATIAEAMNHAVANALGMVCAFALVLETTGELTAEALIDYGRAMAIKLDAENVFADSYARCLTVARDEAERVRATRGLS